MRRLSLLSAVLGGLLVGCSGSPPTVSPPSKQVIGLIELRINGLGSDQAKTSVRALPFRGAISGQSLTNMAAGLQLEPQNITIFNTGTRGTDGMRYVSAAYRVRNAASDGTPSIRARSNITLIAVSAGDAADTSAFRAIENFAGTAAPAGVARNFMPTHAMRFDPLKGQAVLSTGAEDLQVFTEAEVAPGVLIPEGGGAPLTYADLGVNTVFPYGFMVHTLSGGRTLAANPAASNFEGRVTFSVKLPQQPSPTDDPWGFRVVLLVVEDSATRVTQSLEEQALGNAVVGTRATTIGATQVNILPGSTYTGAPVASRCITQVRIAGLAGDPAAAYLVKGASCP